MIYNVLAYSAQVAVAAAAAGLLLTALRPRFARLRLYFLQAVLAACLALPLLQEWKPAAPAPTSTVSGPVVTFQPGAHRPASAPVDWNRALRIALPAGMALRAAWLLLGLLRLRQLRRESRPLDAETDAIGRARRLIGVAAELRSSPGLATAATFGFIRPVVVLPSAFSTLPASTQTAVVAHELLHVRRRDWLWTLAEEAVAVVFWFHPAIAWLISRIRLAREQHVDECVAEATGSRDEYVGALLTMAAAPKAAWSPAPLFLRRRTLSQRIHNLIEESSMSVQRSLASFATAAILTVAAAGYAITLFPLNAAPQSGAAPGPVSIQPGGIIESSTPVRYPFAAMKQRIEGAVTVEIALAEDGTVSDARVLAGPEPLRRPALESVLQWRYRKGVNPRTVVATIQFSVPDHIVEPPANQKFASLNTDSLSPDKAKVFRDRLEPLIGSNMAEVRSSIVAAAAEIDPAVSIGWSIAPVTGDNTITLSERDQDSAAIARKIQFPPPPEGVQRLRIGGNLQSNKIILQPRPLYPALAKQAKLQGTVRFETLINRDGTVRSLAVASGHPLLVDAAQDAVRQWTWQPTHLNGSPVEVLTMVDVNFTLLP